MNRRVGAAEIAARKGAAFPVITAYDAPFARCAEAAGIDVILVGDSLGMVVLGYDSTVHVELADMIRHGAAAARGAQRAHVVVDLPFGTYEASDELAVASSAALVKHGGASSVKLEGGERAAARIRAIVAAGNKLFVLSEGGDLVLVEADGDKYQEKARAAVLGRASRAHLALAHGLLYARDNKKLVCWKVKK